MRKSVRTLTYVVTFGVGIGIGAAIGSSSSAPSSAAHSAPRVTAAPAAAPATSTAPAPAPVPSPDGTYQGACSYTVGSDPVNGTAVATGDVDVTNTGNIGTVVEVSISWPQQGYAPLKMTKTVKIPAGGENDVQFHKTLSFDQLDNLQNWQTGHDFNNGCKYNATITDTYGAVKG